jgi:hypothetical protein
VLSTHFSPVGHWESPVQLQSLQTELPAQSPLAQSELSLQAAPTFDPDPELARMSETNANATIVFGPAVMTEQMLPPPTRTRQVPSVRCAVGASAIPRGPTSETYQSPGPHSEHVGKTLAATFRDGLIFRLW